MLLGFKREDLTNRYDVSCIQEDEWHAYTEETTRKICRRYLAGHRSTSDRLLNAGCGGSSVRVVGWEEIPLDLFLNPLERRNLAICANIEKLPFAHNVFGATICTGEVLGYCDPRPALAELSRVTREGGILICDFGNTRSAKHWFTPTYARAAEVVTDSYNGTPERIWIYSADYIHEVLIAVGFRILKSTATHTWSAIFRRAGGSPRNAVCIERCLKWLPLLPARWGDLLTVVAVKISSGKEQ